MDYEVCHFNSAHPPAKACCYIQMAGLLIYLIDKLVIDLFYAFDIIEFFLFHSLSAGQYSKGRQITIKIRMHIARERREGIDR